MKFPRLTLIAALAVVAPLITGCAEEDAEGREAAYPVGATVPPAEPPPMASAPQTEAEAEPAPPGNETGPEEGVVVGDDDSEAPSGDPAAVDTSPSALTDFRGALDPYGTWVDDPTYGTVWVPSASVVGADFAPYQTAGHWAYDDDYVWVSDYAWGWAPFHYGRWVFGGGGWEWIPGHAYAGAWVSWRYGWGDWGYVGWAPLAPTWCWRRGIAVGLGFVPRAPYGFVATADLFHPRVGSRFIGGERVGAIAAHTRPWEPGGGSAVGGARVYAHPGVGGPPPSELHIGQSAVLRADSDRGVMQARAFARTAALPRAGGAMTGMSRSAPMGGVRSAAAYGGAAAPSHFGGRLGAGFTGSGVTYAPRALPYTGASRRDFGAPSAASRGYSVAGPPPAYRAAMSPPAYHAAAPQPGAHAAAPAFRGYAGGFSTGAVHSGGGYSGGGGGGGFHAGGGGGGGGFHAGGGGGGFHGGGGGGGHGGGHR